eukprot:g2679.t1
MPSAEKRKKDKEALEKAKRLAEKRGEEVEQLTQKVQQLMQQLQQLQQPAATNSRASSSSSTPPGRGTPARRVSAARPASSLQETPEEREETKDETADGDQEEEEEAEEEEEEDNEHDMHIMRQLLQGFRDQGVLSEDREAVMRSAGGQFTELLTQHWTEGSEPPAWLVSLFRPVIGTGDDGSSPCLIVSVERAPRYSGGEPTKTTILCRYLFNVGESTQRFCGEASVKLAKVNKVFLTGTGAEEHAGLSGLILTLSSLVSPTLEVFGPAGVDKLVKGLQAFGPPVDICPTVSAMPLPLGPGESQCSYVLGDEHMEVRCGVVDPARGGPVEKAISVDSHSSEDSSSSSSSSSSSEESSGSDEESNGTGSSEEISGSDEESDGTGSSEDSSDEEEAPRASLVPAGIPARGPAVLYRCRVLYGEGTTFLVLSCPNVSYIPAVRAHAIVREARGKDSVLFVFHFSPEDVVEDAAYAPLLELEGTHVLLGFGRRGRARGAGGLQHRKIAERSVQLNFVAPTAFPLHSVLKAEMMLAGNDSSTISRGICLSGEGGGRGGSSGGGSSSEVVGHTLTKAVLLPASARGIDLSAVRPPVDIDEIRQEMELRLDEEGLRDERDSIVVQLFKARGLVRESPLPPGRGGVVGSRGRSAFSGMRESGLPPSPGSDDERTSGSSDAPQTRVSSFLPPPPPPPPTRGDPPSKRARRAGSNNAWTAPRHSSAPLPPSPPPPEPPSFFSGGGMAGAEVFFLGTGSAAPTKNRGCSGILLRVPYDASARRGRGGGGGRGGGHRKPLRLLIDAGEGTLGHLERQFGREGARREIRGLDCVWISHKHADHHTGLFRLIAEHHRAREASGLQERGRGGGRKASQRATPDPLVVVAPSAVLTFINACKEFSGEDVLYQAMECKEILRGKTWQGGGAGGREGGSTRRVSALLDGMRSVPVHHCREAYGLVVQLRKGGAKLVYSGDTRPYDGLIRAGAGASLLIHEATFDDSRQQDAVMKRHCTTSEALEVGRRMRARDVVLTHFSQRYARVPVLDPGRTQRYCVAFDGMVLNSATVGALPAAANLLSQLLEPKEEDDEGAQEEIVPA